MKSEPEVIQAVEAAGGRFMIDGDRLGILPRRVLQPVSEEVRYNKVEINKLLEERKGMAMATKINVADFFPWLLDRCLFRDRWWWEPAHSV
jgi:hypothetical protein